MANGWNGGDPPAVVFTYAPPLSECQHSPVRQWGAAAAMRWIFSRASRASCRSPLMVCKQTIAGQWMGILGMTPWPNHGAWAANL